MSGSVKAGDREIWQNVVSAAENVRSGEKQAENVAVLAQIFAQVNASMHFAVVHGLRWYLSDEAIVAQILLLFSTNSQLLIQGCTGDTDASESGELELSGTRWRNLEDALVHMEHSSALLELLSFKGSESPTHAGLRQA
jgi:hypothetical protein